jgi:cyanophycin synthetase
VNTVTEIPLSIEPNPNWQLRPGYAYNIQQSSMVTFQKFPSDSAAARTTFSFNKIIGRIVEDETHDTDQKMSMDFGLSTAVSLAKATAQLQRFMYIPIVSDQRADILEDSVSGKTIRLIIPWWNINASKITYEFCAKLWNAISAGEAFGDVESQRLEIEKKLKPFVSKSVNEFALVTSARHLNINLIRLTDDILCFGTGARSRLMESTTSDKTSVIGMKIARDKLFTSAMLRVAGLPSAQNALARDVDQAVAIADQFNYPVVIKPADQDQGIGVAADLRSPEAVRAAYLAARDVSENILVEKFISGFTHRLTVVEGEVISVRQRVPGGVTGDGRSTIAELVSADIQSSHAMLWARQRGKAPVKLDEEALNLLQQNAMSPEDVLPNGQFQRLRRRDNINAGGRNRDYDMANVHPHNLELAVAAASALRLNIAGIDFITDDITKSWREVGGGICEVNGTPQLAMRKTPEVYCEIIKRVIGLDPHIPAHLILCADDQNERKAIVATAKKKAPNMTVATSEGLWRDGAVFTQPFSDGYKATISAITRTDTQSMLSVMSVHDLLFNGSPIRCWSAITIQEDGFSKEDVRLLPAIRDILGVSTL